MLKRLKMNHLKEKLGRLYWLIRSVATDLIIFPAISSALSSGSLRMDGGTSSNSLKFNTSTERNRSLESSTGKAES